MLKMVSKYFLIFFISIYFLCGSFITFCKQPLGISRFEINYLNKCDICCQKECKKFTGLVIKADNCEDEYIIIQIAEVSKLNFNVNDNFTRKDILPYNQLQNVNKSLILDKFSNSYALLIKDTSSLLI